MCRGLHIGRRLPRGKARGLKLALSAAMTEDSLMADATAVPTSTVVKSSAYRWVVLGVFMLVAGLSQLLWLNYAPLLTMVQTKYGVSEGLAGGLLLVFPLVYVLLSVPAGQLTDRKGYKYSVGLGAVLNVARKTA